jgi:nitrate ABC transporter ATP-binding subunit
MASPALDADEHRRSMGFVAVIVNSRAEDDNSKKSGVHVELRGVSKSFGDDTNRTEVLHEIDLSIAHGEFLAIVGFSGSGKSTLINLLAGLLKPDAGSIEIDGEPIQGPGPDRGVVFQNYSLLPWLTVVENVQLAVDAVFGHESRSDRATRARRYVEMVGLGTAHWKYPNELSGGMRQRVSVARALAMDPKILLLDEPLSALDALTRATLQSEIEEIWAADRKTVVLITNDVDEAILLADRIVPLRPGPRASLGPSFDVPLGRPRDRAAINDDPHFKKIRNEVSQYLVNASRQSADSRPKRKRTRPDVAPVDLRPQSLPIAR